MFDCQSNFDQAVDTRSGFKVTNIGFNRPHQQTFALFSLTDHPTNRSGLNRITDWRTGPMRFDVSDHVRSNAATLHEVFKHCYLGNLVRRGDRIALAWNKNGIKVSMRGQAMKDGAAGERVMVKNLSSKRVIEGIVRDSGTVVVSTP